MHHLRGLLLPEHAQVVHPREHVVVHSLALLALPSETPLNTCTEMLMNETLVIVLLNDPSVSQLVFTITEKALLGLVSRVKLGS